MQDLMRKMIKMRTKLTGISAALEKQINRVLLQVVWEKCGKCIRLTGISVRETDKQEINRVLP
jgi:hypothetical protein